MFGEAVIIPVILGVTEVLKQSGIPSKYAVLVSLLLGVGVAFLVAVGSTAGETVLTGLVYGLSASGLYSGGKAMLK